MKKNYFRYLRNAGLALAVLIGGTTQAQTVQTFSYTGAVQNWTVPICVSFITVEVRGAAGANASDRLTSNSIGGKGGRAIGVLTVQPGQVLSIFVGGAGNSTTGVGGFNGGGNGGFGSAGSSCNGGNAGGGGGASDVRINGVTLGDRVIVGGGGGGAGRDYCNGSCQPCGCGGSGGAGGGTVGITGDAAMNCGFSYPGNNVNGGAGGSATAGGAGGLGDGGGTPGTTGTLGIGGNGSGGQYDVSGGGGGGGYYGGGGGGGASNGSGVGGGGGGGGSSWTGNLTGASTTSSVQTGDGLVIFTYDLFGPVTHSLSAPWACIGDNITLTAYGLTSYSWSTGSLNNAITVSPSVTTSYYVSGTGTNNCPSGSYITVTVYPLPVLSGAVTPTLLCVGDAATLTANGATSYSWGSVASQTIAVSPSVTTSYTFGGHSDKGCYNTSAVQVDVNPIQLVVTPDTAICLGKTMTLTANGGATYLWSTGSPFSYVIQTPATNTVYTVAATDVNGCGHTATVNVTVNPVPTIQATSTKTNACKGDHLIFTGTGGDTYVWKATSGTIATTSTAAVTPTIDIVTNYTVIGTNSFGCSSSKVLQINVGKCISVEELANANWPEIFPNPSSGVFQVDLGSVESSVGIQVHDVKGAVISDIKASGKVSLDLRSQPNGLYFIHLSMDGREIKVIKVIKE